MSTTRNACTRRSDTNRLLSSRLRSRKTKHDNSSWQPHCHRNYRVSLEGCSPVLDCTSSVTEIPIIPGWISYTSNAARVAAAAPLRKPISQDATSSHSMWLRACTHKIGGRRLTSAMPLIAARKRTSRDFRVVPMETLDAWLEMKEATNWGGLFPDSAPFFRSRGSSSLKNLSAALCRVKLDWRLKTFKAIRLCVAVRQI